MDTRIKTLLAKHQIAQKWKCSPAVFEGGQHVFLPSGDTFFEIITFGGNAVIRGDDDMLAWCKEQYATIPAREILDGQNLYALETKLRSFGKMLGGEHIGYLHLFADRRVKKPEGFTYRLFAGEEISALRTAAGYSDFDNAFSSDPEKDTLAIAAYHGDAIAAIAGCDDYLDALWQIGIDTLPAYRKQGLGAYLVQALADEIEKRQRVAYYTTWSANLASTRVALSTGFYPAWIRYPSRPCL